MFDDEEVIFWIVTSLISIYIVLLIFAIGIIFNNLRIDYKAYKTNRFPECKQALHPYQCIDDAVQLHDSYARAKNFTYDDNVKAIRVKITK